MLNFDVFFENSPFAFNQMQKESYFFPAIKTLHQSHLKNCPEFEKISSLIGNEDLRKVEDLPFIPVRLFKDFDLLSIDKSEIRKTMTSSGTSGGSPSKIYLNSETAQLQTKVLTKIVNSYIGTKRLPMLIIDSKSVLKDRNNFSARGAGILGFSMFGYDIHYALDEDMNIDIEQINEFLLKHENEQILIFGFTFVVYENFIKKLQASNTKLNLNNSLLIHGGGWKKLAENAIENSSFKALIKEWSGISRVFNYYGLVEQTGSIFMECENENLHASIYSDIIFRKPEDFSVCDIEQEGIVQLVSLLPHSYPGHSILTEDIGKLVGVDTCPCGRKGKYFKIFGRIKNAEIRGCSDTIQK